MIKFRCWYCWKNYSVKDTRIGERFTCSCKNNLRVPKTSGGNCRVKTLLDWIIEFVVCGGGALLGFGLSLLIISQTGFFLGWTIRWALLIGLTSGGFLIGLVGGSRGIDWMGNMIRDRETQ